MPQTGSRRRRRIRTRRRTARRLRRRTPCLAEAAGRTDRRGKRDRRRTEHPERRARPVPPALGIASDSHPAAPLHRRHRPRTRHRSSTRRRRRRWGPARSRTVQETGPWRCRRPRLAVRPGTAAGRSDRTARGRSRSPRRGDGARARAARPRRARRRARPARSRAAPRLRCTLHARRRSLRPGPSPAPACLRAAARAARPHLPCRADRCSARAGARSHAAEAARSYADSPPRTRRAPGTGAPGLRESHPPRTTIASCARPRFSDRPAQWRATSARGR